MTLIGEGRAETVQLALPEGGFPKGLGIGTVVIPEAMVAVTWEKNGRSGVMVRAKSIKVEGGQAGLKGRPHERPRGRPVDVDVEMMGDDELAAALLAGAVGADWSEQAAVDLLVAHRGWLGRGSSAKRSKPLSVTTARCAPGCNWHQVVSMSRRHKRIASPGHRLLPGRSASPRSWADLLVGLDEFNIARVLRAVSVACQGRT